MTVIKARLTLPWVVYENYFQDSSLLLRDIIDIT